MKAGLPFVKALHTVTLLVKSVLILSRLKAASVSNAGIQKNILGSGTSGTFCSGRTILIMPNEETKSLMKTVKSLKDSSL